MSITFSKDFKCFLKNLSYFGYYFNFVKIIIFFIQNIEDIITINNLSTQMSYKNDMQL